MPLGRIKPNKDPKALSHRKWDDIPNKVYNLYPGQEIVGWYGVKNGFDAMITEQDQRIHREYFTKSWHVIYLLDGKNESSSFFYWDRDKLKLSSGYYKYQDKNKDSIGSRANRISKRTVSIFFAILVVFSFVFLYKGYNKGYFFHREDKNNTAFDSGDQNQDSGVDRLGQNKTNIAIQDTKDKDIEDKDTKDKDTDKQYTNTQEYIDRISKLEEQLKNKDKSIKELEGEMQSVLSNNSEEDLSQKGDIYIIQRGDNLYMISQKFYNTEKYAESLAKLNRIQDQKSLTIGSYIIIPPLDEIENLR